MRFYNLFSSKERMGVLNLIIFSEEPFRVSDVAKELRLTTGFVSKFFNILTKEKILKKYRNKFVVIDNIHSRTLKIMLTLNSFNPGFFSRYNFIKSAGLYGSSAKGLNTSSSDIDLWVKIKKADKLDLAKFTNNLKKNFKDVNILFLTEDKIRILKKEDTVFYYSLVFGSVLIYGDEPIEV